MRHRIRVTGWKHGNWGQISVDLSSVNIGHRNSCWVLFERPNIPLKYYGDDFWKIINQSHDEYGRAWIYFQRRFSDLRFIEDVKQINAAMRLIQCGLKFLRTSGLYSFEILMQSLFRTNFLNDVTSHKLTCLRIHCAQENKIKLPSHSI